MSWMRDAKRKPLVLRGARQVGKTWMLHDFGRRHFRRCVVCNFDRDEDLKALFASKSPERILGNLELLSGRQIIPGETLLILDEIQECPEALNALKYFFEEKRDLHVAAAGSLLGVLLARHSYPVGAVDLIEMRPMDFSEFIRAVEPALHRAYLELPWDEPVLEPLHRHLTELYHQYLIVGGMPECVADWADRRDPASILRRQRALLRFYEGDFGKHANAVNAAKCLQVFQSVPAQLAKANEKFVYGAVRQGARAKDLEDAITWNVAAGLFHRVHNLARIEVPLRAYRKDDAFKIFLHDTGLIKAMAGIPNEAILLRDAYPFKGQLAENFILEQIVGKFEVEPFYFADHAGRELDFILQVGSDLIPIEVKSGENVKAISLKNYLAKRQPPLAIRFSERNLCRHGNLLDLPLYLAARLPDLLKSDTDGFPA